MTAPGASCRHPGLWDVPDVPGVLNTLVCCPWCGYIVHPAILPDATPVLCPVCERFDDVRIDVASLRLFCAACKRDVRAAEQAAAIPPERTRNIFPVIIERTK